MKTAILVHGHHLLAEGWEDVVWGRPGRGVFGRASRGLLEALQWNADVVFFPTGASERGGVKEGAYTLRWAAEHITELPEFAAMGERDALKWFDERAVPELTSQNTRTEIETCMRIALQRGIERLVLVSSPTHVLRAHREALSLIRENPAFTVFMHALYAVASDVPYAGTTVDDVVIIEPPHRPDRPKVYLNETLKPLQTLRKSEHAEELNESLRDAVKTFQKKYNT